MWVVLAAGAGLALAIGQVHRARLLDGTEVVLFFNRITFGLNAISMQLGAAGNFTQGAAVSSVPTPVRRPRCACRASPCPTSSACSR
ncbi:MAG TPA: hypothetical protein VM734_21310 [Kofleriaceae bacterium]|nr:hypothetical protein [Kofleriaceae bacterium]